MSKTHSRYFRDNKVICYRYIQDVLKVYARYIQWYSTGIRLEFEKGILNGILKAFEIVN